MKIATLPLGPLKTNVYILTNPATNDAIIIDVAPLAYETLKTSLQQEGLNVAAIFITHAHWDHIGDVTFFQKQGIPVYAHKDSRVLMENPAIMSLFSGNITIEPVTIDYQCEQDELLTVAGLQCEVKAVPGHCPGSVAYYFKEEKSCFVGDVLFAGSVGRTDFPGGSHHELIHSIKTQLYTLPGETVIYPGHGPATSIAHEKQSNMFVR